MKDPEKSKDQLIAELIELRRQLADINDISDRKKMETQLQVAGKFEALGTLADGIAHDFNNLLMGIQGNISLILLGTDKSLPHYERLKQIEQLIQSGAGLTRQLLGFTKGGKCKEENIQEELLKGNETILIVDDDEAIVDVGGRMLTKMGYAIRLSRSGKEALEIYNQDHNEIDAVILDLIMPNMSGKDTFDALKEINPDVKVLLSSGYSINGQASEILSHGCSGFIQKPFTMSGLSKKLREILDDPQP